MHAVAKCFAEVHAKGPEKHFGFVLSNNYEVENSPYGMDAVLCDLLRKAGFETEFHHIQAKAVYSGGGYVYTHLGHSCSGDLSIYDCGATYRADALLGRGKQEVWGEKEAEPENPVQFFVLGKHGLMLVSDNYDHEVKQSTDDTSVWYGGAVVVSKRAPGKCTAAQV